MYTAPSKPLGTISRMKSALKRVIYFRTLCSSSWLTRAARHHQAISVKFLLQITIDQTPLDDAQLKHPPFMGLDIFLAFFSDFYPYLAVGVNHDQAEVPQWRSALKTGIRLLHILLFDIKIILLFLDHLDDFVSSLNAFSGKATNLGWLQHPHGCGLRQRPSLNCMTSSRSMTSTNTSSAQHTKQVTPRTWSLLRPLTSWLVNCLLLTVNCQITNPLSSGWVTESNIMFKWKLQSSDRIFARWNCSFWLVTQRATWIRSASLRVIQGECSDTTAKPSQSLWTRKPPWFASGPLPDALLPGTLRISTWCASCRGKMRRPGGGQVWKFTDRSTLATAMTSVSRSAWRRSTILHTSAGWCHSAGCLKSYEQSVVSEICSASWHCTGQQTVYSILRLLWEKGGEDPTGHWGDGCLLCQPRHAQWAAGGQSTGPTAGC